MKPEFEILKELDEISSLGDDSRIDYVIQLLIEDPREIVREAAGQCLKSFLSESAAEKVFELLCSEDAYVRNTATKILASYWPISCSVLTNGLRDKNKHIRKYALDALYMANNPDAISLCSLLLKDEEVNNIAAAVEYLGQTYDQRYVDEILPVLEKSIKEKQLILSVSCLEALANLCDESCSEKIFRIIPHPEELEELLIPSYLRLFSKICRFQDSYILILISYNHTEKFYKEIIDATNDYLKKYYHILDEIQKNLLFSWLYKIFEEYPIPSENLYEILLLLSELVPENISKKIPEFLDSEDFHIKLAAIEIVEKLNLVEYKKLIEKVLEQANFAKTKILSKMQTEKTGPNDLQTVERLETVISAATNTLSVLKQKRG